MKPNILCICTDQQRADHLGCAGNPDLKTPNLDQLASDGLLFTKSYVANPVCSPNQACLFTGQYPKSNGLRENGNALPTNTLSLPQVLKENGYFTFSSGKLHLSPYGADPNSKLDEYLLTENKSLWDSKKHTLPLPYYGLESVFFVGGHGHYNFGDSRNSISQDESNGYIREHAAYDSHTEEEEEEVWCLKVQEENHYNIHIANKTIQFIEERDDSKPFFGWCSFPDPHHPFSPPEPWYSMYKGEDITINRCPDKEDENLPLHLKEYKEKMRISDENLAEDIAKNYGMISMVDHNIGRIIKYLKENKLYENTIIVFLSDHGDYMGDHGIKRKAILPYDGVYRVPTIWKTIDATKATGQTDALHSSVDLMPTLLDLADIEIPETVQGFSQAPVLSNQKEKVRDYTYAEYDNDYRYATFPDGTPDHLRCRFLRDDQYYFAYFEEDDFGMLFDMKADPQQQINLYTNPNYSQIIQNLFKLLAKESLRTEPWKPNKVSWA